MRRALAFTWAAAIDLLLDSVLGTLWFLLVFVLLVTGVATLPAAGIGFVVLALAAALTRVTGPVERLRANALLGTDVEEPRRQRTSVVGWKRPFAQGLVGLRDPMTWRILLHHFASMVTGTLVVFIAWIAIESAVELVLGEPGLLTSPFFDLFGAGPSVVVGIVALLAIVPVIYLAGQFDRVVIAPLLGQNAEAGLREEIDTLSGARQAAVDASAIERQRIERDLHDGAQPRLVSVAMTLGMAKAKLDSDPAAARLLIDQAHADAKSAITELRQLARGIHPAVLTDRGLDAALSALASRCTVPTRVEVNVPERLSPEVEAVVYFAIAEALTNVSKHSAATTCRVYVSCVDGVVSAGVIDDGLGGATIEHDGGLAGIQARVRSAGGMMSIDSPAGGPTHLVMELPCAS
jgi:signal transduction histidine kinase